MFKIKWLKWYTVIPIILIFVFCFLIWLSPYGELNKIKNKQIENIGFAGLNVGELHLVFPEEQQEEFLEMLKEATIKAFPTRVGEHKGGGPLFRTRVIFSDKSSIDFSYVNSKNSFIYINGKAYVCDKETIEKYRLINAECRQFLH